MMVFPQQDQVNVEFDGESVVITQINLTTGETDVVIVAPQLVEELCRCLKDAAKEGLLPAGLRGLSISSDRG